MDTMTMMLMEMKGIDKLYAVCAIAGGGLFIIRTIMQFTVGGLDFDGGGDVGMDIGGDMDHDLGHDGSDSDHGFRILSLQALTAFFMMFGLVGLALSMQTGWNEPQSLAGGFGAGALSVYLIKVIYDQASKLQSSGNIDLKRYAVGSEGEVYLTIPAEGNGQVQVTIQNHMKIFDAVSSAKIELKTGVPIRVVDVLSGSILKVEKTV